MPVPVDLVNAALTRVGKPAFDLRASLSPVRSAKGDSVQLDGNVSKVFEEMTEAIAPIISAAYKNLFEPIAIDAFHAWPVKTGFSRSALSIEYSLTEEGFMGSVVNRAPYAKFIKSKGLRPVTDLMFKPGERAADRMVEYIESRGGDL